VIGFYERKYLWGDSESKRVGPLSERNRGLRRVSRFSGRDGVRAVFIDEVSFSVLESSTIFRRSISIATGCQEPMEAIRLRVQGRKEEIARAPLVTT
jgi:hypothetical protein